MSDRIAELLDRARELAKTATKRAKEAPPPDHDYIACAVVLDEAAALVEELERLVLEACPVAWLTNPDGRAEAVAWERKMVTLLGLEKESR
jgi:hypothetical protein